MNDDVTPTHESDLPAEPSEESEPATEPAPQSAAQRKTIFARLRATGEQGKRQWEDAFHRARHLFAKPAEVTAEGIPQPEVAEGEVSEIAAEAAEAVEEPTPAREWGQLYVRAQERGADLLLRVVGRIRQGVEDLEKSLAKRAPQEQPEQAAAA